MINMRIIFLALVLMSFFSIVSAKAINLPQISHQRFSLKTHEIRLYDASQDQIKSINELRARLKHTQRLVAAINGPLFHSNYKTVGLYIKDSMQHVPLNMKDGKGNFYVKPNGVFYIKDNRARIVTTQRYQQLNVKPSLAIQSGPLLVINGKINSAVKNFKISKKNRSAVVTYINGEVGIVISNSLMSISGFSKTLRDTLNVRQALYLDGAIAGYWSDKYSHNLDFPYASILAVTKKKGIEAEDSKSLVLHQSQIMSSQAKQ